MKIIVGIGVCICGLIVWVAPLVAALTRGHPTAVSLGVIIGGVIIMSGIALVCLPNYPIKVPYFDKRPFVEQQGYDGREPGSGVSGEIAGKIQGISSIRASAARRRQRKWS